MYRLDALGSLAYTKKKKGVFKRFEIETQLCA